MSRLAGIDERRMSRLAGLLPALAVAVLLSACGGSTPTPAGSPAVTVQLTAANLAFEQTQLTVPAGVTFAIEFDNRDNAPHNVVISGAGQSRSGDAFSGPQTRTYVFAALPPGTYRFACAIHPDMTGVLESTALSGVTK